MTNIFKGLLTLNNLIIVLIVLVTIDLITRYWSIFHLPFDLNNSQIFNNIASPIISFAGFIGVIATITLMRKQNLDTKNLDLYNYYKDKESLFFKKINKVLKPGYPYGNSSILEPDELIFEMLNELDSLEKKLKNLNPDGMGVDDIKQSRDFIINFLLESYVQRIADLTPEFKSHLFEIESNKLLKQHYKKSLIEYFISNYFLSYVIICDSTILLNIISQKGGNMKNRFYEIYDLFIRNKKYQKILSNYAPTEYERIVRNH